MNKNIHIIPTNKPTGIFESKNGLHFSIIEKIRYGEFKGFHIYITSDEEIKEGDWIYFPISNEVLKIGNGPFEASLETVKTNEDCKKIILTTDQDLIKDGVQAIDDTFLEWFVNNPSCERVDLDTFSMGNKVLYNVVFPKEKQIKCYCGHTITCDCGPLEEPKQEWNPTQGEEVWIKVFSNWSSGKYIGYDVNKKVHLVREHEEGGGNLFSSAEVLPYYAMPNEPKQETLEEIRKYAELSYYNGDEVNAFIDGVKYQSKRVYSEEDMINFHKWAYQKNIIEESDKTTKELLKEWFEKFKK